jgi:negative regulator of flagellin synthesis FlgM
VKITNGIDSTGGLERPGADQAGAARTKPAAGAAGGPGTTDTIRISDLSSQLAVLENRFAADGAFDASRVEAIKGAMREGRFTVNPEAVADKLLESVRELLRKPS